MKNMRWIVLTILLIAYPCFATTYYSDYSTGNDSANGTSTSTPWKHIPGMSGWIGSATLSSGDIVVMKGGVTWTFASTTDDILAIGSSGVTIQGGQLLGTPWGAGYPVLDGTGTTGSRQGIYMNNKTSVVINGLKIYNTQLSPSGSSGIFVYGSASNVEIKNCYLLNTGDQSIRVIPSNGSSHILIHDNITENVGRMFFVVNDANSVDDVQIYNNTFLGPGNWPGGIIGGVHGDGIMIGSECTAANTCLTHLKIHHNKFYGDWAQGATALIFLQNGTASGGTQYGGNHVEVYDNQIAIDSDGLLSDLMQVWAIWNDLKIYNNTFGAYTGGSIGVTKCLSFTHASTNIDVKNNIFSGCIQSAIYAGEVATNSSLTADYNYYSTEITRFFNGWPPGSADCRSISACQGSPFNQEAHGRTGDPKFVTLSNGSNGSGNWSIQSSSPAINVGYNLGSNYNTDILAISRPQGSAWDIGAYEYASGSGSTTILGNGASAGNGAVIGSN